MHRANRSSADGSRPRSLAMTIQAAAVAFAVPLALFALTLITPPQLDEVPRLCLWSALLGGPCPACGLTHALCSLVHGDFSQAVRYNRGVIVAAPALLAVW